MSLNRKKGQLSEYRVLVFLIPNLFTALNMLAGVAAVVLAINENFYNAGILLFLAAIFDSVDGRLARLTNSQSEFGEQFDSFSDLISFGLAPALCMYLLFFSDFGMRGIIIPFVFLLCGALRLARFNINAKKISKDYFQGMSIPVAALGMAGIIFLNNLIQLDEYRNLVAAYMLIYALFMISNIPFYSFKSFKSKKIAFILVLFIVGTILIYEYVMIFAYINLYVICSLILFLKNKGNFKNVFTWASEVIDENDS